LATIGRWLQAMIARFRRREGVKERWRKKGSLIPRPSLNSRKRFCCSE